MTTTRLFAAVGATVALALPLALASVDARQMKNASDGVYTAAQATRGSTLYDTSCASCHELSKFKGPEFVKAWTDKPMTELHAAVVSMPMDAPGSMKPQEYADIIAYFLSLNGYPAGQAELEGSDAAIKGVKIDVKK
jgi:cytochrome c5